jgi:apolipoprotein N-acyltransferase
MLGLFAFVPLLHSIYKAKNWQDAFWGSSFFGLIFFGGIFFWLWDTYPLNWAGVEGAFASGVMILAFWSFTSLSMAVFVGLWGGLLHKTRNLTNDFILMPATLWILIEFLRIYLFSILWAGTGTLVGAHWTFGAVGYILSESPFFLSLAGIGGLYLLSFFLILMNSVFYQLISNIKSRNFNPIAIAPLLLLIILISVVNIYSLNNETPRNDVLVAVIQTNFPSYFNLTTNDHEERSKKHLNLIYSIKKDGFEPDLVILPEGSRFFGLLSDSDANLIFNSEMGIGTNEKLIIDSGPVEHADGERSTSLVYLNSKTKERFETRKKLLTPNGEYLPHLSSFLVSSILQKKQWANNFQVSRGYVTEGDIHLGKIADAKIGALFCSEVMSPILYRDVTNMGANILVNVASHSVFNSSPALRAQVMKASKTRAVENNRYYVQAGDGIESFIIDNRGRIVSSSFDGEGSVLYDNIPSITTNSAYMRFGDWPLILGLIYMLILLATPPTNKRLRLYKVAKR